MHLIISIILIILVILLFWIYSKNKQEHFDAELNAEHHLWDPAWVGKKALDCYSLDKRDCMKYSNCGLCLKDGKMECIPGDEQGPLFKEGCRGWMHTNYYDRNIFGERVTTISPPWSHQYADYEAWFPSRQVVQTL